MTRIIRSACAASFIIVGAASACLAASPLARLTRIVLPGSVLVVGENDPAAQARLDCAAQTFQRTILRCSLPPAAVPLANVMGRRVASAVMNVHFQGTLLDLSIAFAPGNSAREIIGQIQAASGQEPRIQYWADQTHLFASYIWTDSATEVEIARMIKGPRENGGARMYVSTLLGGLPLNPKDAR